MTTDYDTCLRLSRRSTDQRDYSRYKALRGSHVNVQGSGVRFESSCENVSDISDRGFDFASSHGKISILLLKELLLFLPRVFLSPRFAFHKNTQYTSVFRSTLISQVFITLAMCHQSPVHHERVRGFALHQLRDIIDECNIDISILVHRAPIFIVYSVRVHARRRDFED